MSDPARKEEQPPEEEERIHPIQRLMDNPWALLVIGLVFCAISYTGWGWLEYSTMKQGVLP